MIIQQPEANSLILVKNTWAYFIEVGFGQTTFAKVFAEDQTNSDNFSDISNIYSAQIEGKTSYWFAEILKNVLYPIAPNAEAITEQIFISKKCYLKFGNTESNKFYAILAGKHFLEFTKNKDLGKLLSKPIKYLSPEELDFMTVLFEQNSSFPINFKINYESNFSHSFQESLTIKKNVVTNIPIGFAQKNYASYFPLEKIKSVEIFLGGTTTTTTATKPIRFRQQGDQIIIERNEGSFIADGWQDLNFPYYLENWFYWNDLNPYQTFSLLGLIQSATDVSETQIIFDRIGDPIEDPVTLANENIWLAALLQLVTMQAGGQPTPTNPEKSEMYGTFSETTTTGEEAKTIIYPKKSPCKKGFEKNFIYLNSYAAWESMLFEGKFEETTNVEQELFAHHLPQNYTPQNAVLQTFNTNYFKSYKAFSGYFSKKIIEQSLIDFLASEYIMIFLPNYGFVPIVLLSKKYLTNKESNYIGLEIEYRFSFNEIAPILPL